MHSGQRDLVLKNKKATITDDPTPNPMADSDFSRQHSELRPGNGSSLNCNEIDALAQQYSFYEET